jgi:hypothetical protein
MKLSVSSPIVVLVGPPTTAVVRTVLAVTDFGSKVHVPVLIGGKRAHRAWFSDSRFASRRSRIAT